MATLPEIDRLRIWRGLMRYLGFGWAGVKDDLKAAVDATDVWVDANTASYNNALPVTFRDNATADQKSLLLVAVVMMRFNIELLKRIFGEVD